MTAHGATRLVFDSSTPKRKVENPTRLPEGLEMANRVYHRFMVLQSTFYKNNLFKSSTSIRKEDDRGQTGKTQRKKEGEKKILTEIVATKGRLQKKSQTWAFG